MSVSRMIWEGQGKGSIFTQCYKMLISWMPAGILEMISVTDILTAKKTDTGLCREKDYSSDLA